jgi:glycosyltransferase involved in cell wall biosynthesis
MSRTYDAVSVLLPTYQARAHLPGCFAALWRQTWAGPMEVVVADGGSTDGTQALVDAEIANGRPVRMVPNPERIQAEGLNRAAAVARHDLLIRCDAQSRLPPDAVELLVEEHGRIPMANVGGRQVAVASGSAFGDAVAAVYNTRLGSGGARYRRGTRPAEVDTVYLGSWPKAAFLAVGGFDPSVGPNEDSELNLRWRRAGGRVRLLPQLAIAYQPRTTPVALARQYFRYGYWRTRTLRRHRALHPRQIAALAPLSAALMALAGRTVPALGQTTALPLAGYGALVIGAGLTVPGRPAVRLLAPVALAIMHLSWGAGFLTGLATLGSRGIMSARLAATRVQ